MYSLNAPVPSAVAALAADLAGEVPTARARSQGSHTLVVKRLGGGDHAAYARHEATVREALAGTGPFAARVAGVGVFEDVPTGAAPVVYLRVDSPGVERVHETLCERVDPVAGIEGEDYVPHVTVARGGDRERARAVAERDIDPVEWAVEELVFWDAEREQSVSRLALG